MTEPAQKQPVPLDTTWGQHLTAAEWTQLCDLVSRLRQIGLARRDAAAAHDKRKLPAASR